MIDYVSKGLVNLQCIRKKVFTMDLLGVKGKALYPANVCVCEGDVDGFDNLSD